MVDLPALFIVIDLWFNGWVADKQIDKTRRMAEAKVFPLLVRMSGPAMFSMLIMSLYNIIDSLFVSSISEIALRSVSIIFPVQQLMVAFAVGTSVGVNSYVARRLGAEIPRRTVQPLHMVWFYLLSIRSSSWSPASCWRPLSSIYSPTTEKSSAAASTT